MEKMGVSIWQWLYLSKLQQEFCEYWQRLKQLVKKTCLFLQSGNLYQPCCFNQANKACKDAPQSTFAHWGDWGIVPRQCTPLPCPDDLRASHQDTCLELDYQRMNLCSMTSPSIVATTLLPSNRFPPTPLLHELLVLFPVSSSGTHSPFFFLLLPHIVSRRRCRVIKTNVFVHTVQCWHEWQLFLMPSGHSWDTTCSNSSYSGARILGAPTPGRSICYNSMSFAQLLFLDCTCIWTPKTDTDSTWKCSGFLSKATGLDDNKENADCRVYWTP